MIKLIPLIVVTAALASCSISGRIDDVIAEHFCAEGETLVSVTRGLLDYEVKCSDGSIISIPYRK